MDTEDLSLDRIREYLADLGYEGVPEETLLQLKGELLHRLTAEAPGSAPVPTQPQPDEAIARQGRDQAPPRRKQRRSSADLQAEAPADTRLPTYTNEYGEVQVYNPDTRTTDQKALPSARAGYDPAPEDEYIADTYTKASIRTGQQRHGAPRANARPSSGRPAEQRSYDAPARPSRPSTARSAGTGSGYPYYSPATYARPSLYQTGMLYTTGMSKYSLEQKKLRKSDPVSNYAKYSNMWNRQGGLDDVHDRARKPRYMAGSRVSERAIRRSDLYYE